MYADAAELVNQGEAGEDRPVVDPYMAGQRGVVDQDAVVADAAVAKTELNQTTEHLEFPQVQMIILDMT